MRTSRRELATQALEKSLEIRESLGYDFRSPLCVFTACDKLGLKVQLVSDISMEGIYIALQRPTILISSLRPLVRRVFTCAHELAHHVFDHGSTIDELRDDLRKSQLAPNEFLANAFAGFFLMPVQAVKRSFSDRNTSPKTAAATDILAIASSFGVGYETLVSHLQHALRLIDSSRANTLPRIGLSGARRELLCSRETMPLTVLDEHYYLETADVEVGTLILLPRSVSTEGDNIEVVREAQKGVLFRAVRPGLTRAYSQVGDWSVIVRVSRFQYAGLARYRHLEETDGV